jgi:hypothetical protein
LLSGASSFIEIDIVAVITPVGPRHLGGDGQCDRRDREAGGPASAASGRAKRRRWRRWGDQHERHGYLE